MAHRKYDGHNFYNLKELFRDTIRLNTRFSRFGIVAVYAEKSVSHKLEAVIGLGLGTVPAPHSSLSAQPGNWDSDSGFRPL